MTPAPPLRLVFLGAGAFGLPTAVRLGLDHEIALVVTQPDRPAGRGRRIVPTPIGAWAGAEGHPLLKTADVNAPDALERVAAARPDAMVIIAFGQKLGLELLAGRFAVNLHGSLLPKYRGAAPINWAMIEGEQETGLSVITIAQRMDAGDVLGRCATPIDPGETAGELHDRLAEMGPALVAEVLDRFRDGTLTPEPQDETLATKAPKLSKADGTVGFDRPADAVRARIHGLTPWPGCTVTFAGRTLRIRRVRVHDREADGPPGTLHADGTVACAPGCVQLLEVQPPGGRLMSFEDYIHGHPLEPDARTETL